MPHNNGMKFDALIGWGIVIYAVMRLTWDGLVIYGITSGFTPRIIELAMLVILATIAGRSLRFASWKDVLPYSLSWAVIAALLDMVYTVPFSGWQMYSDWNVWVGYAFVVLLPLMAPRTRRAHGEPAHIS